MSVIAEEIAADPSPWISPPLRPCVVGRRRHVNPLEFVSNDATIANSSVTSHMSLPLLLPFVRNPPAPTPVVVAAEVHKTQETSRRGASYWHGHSM